MLQFFSMLGVNLLVILCFFFAVAPVRFLFFACFLWIGVAIYWELFLFWFGWGPKKIYAVCTFFLVPWEGCGTWGLGQGLVEANNGVWFCLSGHMVAWTVWVVCRGLLLCATRWRGKRKIGQGPIEQCVGDFCSVSRGSVEKKSVEVRLSSVSRNLALCYEVAWKE